MGDCWRLAVVLESGRGRAVRIRGWRRSFRPWRCRSNRRPSPSTASRPISGSVRRRRRRCTWQPWPGVVDDRVRAALLHGHVQGAEHEFGAMAPSHRPAHDPAAEDIEHDGQVQESHLGRHIGGVGLEIRKLTACRKTLDSSGSYGRRPRFSDYALVLLAIRFHTRAFTDGTLPEEPPQIVRELEPFGALPVFKAIVSGSPQLRAERHALPACLTDELVAVFIGDYQLDSGHGISPRTRL